MLGCYDNGRPGNRRTALGFWLQRFHYAGGFDSLRALAARPGIPLVLPSLYLGKGLTQGFISGGLVTISSDVRSSKCQGTQAEKRCLQRKG